MIWKKDIMRFNELAKTLKKLGMEMSHPTLLDHLNHLIKERLVTRREEKAQYVTYRLNVKRIGESKKYLDRAIRIEKNSTKEKEELFSFC
jgi:DNA-binding HxlR family transcriptional regulator